jgi:hypothetical protein
MENFEMSMRDKIAEICCQYMSGPATDEMDQKCADAILRALPDMIAPLVWNYRGDVSCTAYTPFGKYTVETCHEDGYGMWTPRDDTEDDPPFGYHYGLAQAQAAADTHHRAAIMAAFKEGAA